MTCGCCGEVIPELTVCELCWYCEGPLCVDCWEDTGHCGHPEADAIDEVAEVGLLTSASLLEAIAVA